MQNQNPQYELSAQGMQSIQLLLSQLNNNRDQSNHAKIIATAL